MDYPVAAGLVGGKFTNGNPGAGVPASIIEADWGNAVTDEILAIQAAAGLTPTEGNNAQLLTALRVLCRTRLASNLTLFVNGSGGSDSNDGLTTGTAFATISHAAAIAATRYDANGWVITIQVAAGTYGPCSLSGPIVGGALGPGSLIINGASAGTVTVSGGASSAILATLGAALTIQNMTVTTSSALASSLLSTNGSLIVVGTGMVFSSASGPDISANSGSVQIGASYSITGSAAAHFSASNGGNITIQSGLSPTVTLSGTPSFSGAFAQSSVLGILTIPAATVTFSGGATGVRYSSTLNSVINTGGAGASFFPGSSAGSTATGGLYA